MQKSEIVDILNKQLGAGYVNTNGESIHRCPFCKHSKKKLQIEIETQYWHCWICNSKGRSIISLLNKINTPEYLIEEIRRLLPKKQISTSSKKSKYEPLELPKEYKSLSIKSESYLYKKCISYLMGRGFKLCDILKYNLGYCTSGKFENMIIIPSYNKHGNLNFYTGHSFINSSIKFRNPEIDRNVIGFESTLAETERIILVESPFDAITVGRNAIPLFGKVLSDELKNYIIESNINEIVICLDGDALKSAMSTCNYLMALGKKVFLVELDFEIDPNDLGHEDSWKKIESAEILTESSALKNDLKVKFNEKYK